MSQQQAELDTERYNLSWKCALRLNYAFLDGYLTQDEFEHILHELGLLTEWRHHANRKS